METAQNMFVSYYEQSGSKSVAVFSRWWRDVEAVGRDFLQKCVSAVEGAERPPERWRALARNMSFLHCSRTPVRGESRTTV